jgi:hypothetical protein
MSPTKAPYQGWTSVTIRVYAYEKLIEQALPRETFSQEVVRLCELAEWVGQKYGLRQAPEQERIVEGGKVKDV